MKSKDFSIDREVLSRGELIKKQSKIQSSITEFIDKSKLHAYEQMYSRLCSWKLNGYINLKNAHDDVVAVTQMIDHLRYGGPVVSDNNFLNTQVFVKIPLKVNGHDTTLKEELQKYFDAESFKKNSSIMDFKVLKKN